ncbi:hypothetical protein RUND412_008992 [Rhizina undulata]
MDTNAKVHEVKAKISHPHKCQPPTDEHDGASISGVKAQISTIGSEILFICFNLSQLSDKLALEIYPDIAEIRSDVKKLDSNMSKFKKEICSEIAQFQIENVQFRTEIRLEIAEMNSNINARFDNLIQPLAQC